MDFSKLVTRGLLVDAAVSAATSVVQLGEPSAVVIGPTIAADVLYSAAIESYVQREFGGQGGPLEDSYTRDVLAKSAIATGISFVVNSYTGGEVDIFSSVINSLVTFTASNGIQNLL